MIGAVAVIAAPGPVTTGSADQGDTVPDDNDQNDNNDENGDENDQNVTAVTTLCVDKTAEGFWERAMTYAWSVEKEIYENDRVVASEDDDGFDLVIERGESAVVSYLIEVEAEGPCAEDAVGVRGEIVVTNTGSAATEQLEIWDVVQIKTDGCEFVDLVKVKVDTSAKPVLAAGECFAYSYEILFEPVKGACYNNHVEVTICNYVDHDGAVFGVADDEAFELPCEPDVYDVDKVACLEDRFVVPEGFSVEAMCETGPWHLDAGGETASWEFPVNLRVTNDCAPGDMCFVLCNEAVLVPEDSLAGMVAHAPLNIYSGAIETTLAVEKTAETSWSEQVEIGVDLPEGWPVNEVLIGENDVDVEIMPMVMSQYIIRDDGMVQVWGLITVTNTGMYATEGLSIVDTVQMWDEECWIDLASVSVDVSCKPVLEPGESFSYPYATSFCLENISLVLNWADFVNVAYVEICNYDAEAGISGVYFYLPLEFPLNPTVMTMETNVVCSFEEIAPLPHTGLDSEIVFQTEVCYHQMVVVRFCEDRTVVDTWTNVTARTVLSHSCWHEEVCAELDTAIYHAESAVICGNDRKAVVTFEATTYDNDTMDICILCYPVQLTMCSVLYTSNLLCVDLDENTYIFQNLQLMFYGVYASFEWPEEAFPDEVVEE